MRLTGASHACGNVVCIFQCTLLCHYPRMLRRRTERFFYYNQTHWNRERNQNPFFYLSNELINGRKFAILKLTRYLPPKSLLDDNNRMWMVNNVTNWIAREEKNNCAQADVESDAFNARTDKPLRVHTQRTHHQMSRKFVQSKHRSFHFGCP